MRFSAVAVRQFSTTLLLCILLVTSIFWPHMAHIPNYWVVKECVFRTGFLRHGLGGFLLPFAAVGDHLVLLTVLEARSSLALERRLHGLVDLHEVLSIDHGDELFILRKLLYYHVVVSQGLEVMGWTLVLLCSRHEILFAFLSSFVHLFHLLVDYAEDGIGLKLHWPWYRGSLGVRRVVAERPAAVSACFVRLKLVWYYTGRACLFWLLGCVILPFLLALVGIIKIHRTSTNHVGIS